MNVNVSTARRQQYVYPCWTPAFAFRSHSLIGRINRPASLAASLTHTVSKPCTYCWVEIRQTFALSSQYLCEIFYYTSNPLVSIPKSHLLWEGGTERQRERDRESERHTERKTQTERETETGCVPSLLFPKHQQQQHYRRYGHWLY